MSSEGHQHGGQPCDPSEAAALMDTAEYGLSCLGCGRIGTPSTVHEPTGIYLCAERCVPALAAQPAAGEGITPKRLAAAIADHGDICSRMAIPECATAILAAIQPAPVASGALDVEQRRAVVKSYRDFAEIGMSERDDIMEEDFEDITAILATAGVALRAAAHPDTAGEPGETT